MTTMRLRGSGLKGVAAAGAASVSQPVCVYPAKASYNSGDPKVAES